MARSFNHHFLVDNNTLSIVKLWSRNVRQAHNAWKIQVFRATRILALCFWLCCG